MRVRNVLGFTALCVLQQATALAARPLKDEFYNKLKQVNLIPASVQVVILGDFNIRVGKSLDETDVWYGVRRLHVTGEFKRIRS